VFIGANRSHECTVLMIGHCCSTPT